MKRTIACSLLVALSVFIVPLARAQSQGMGGMDMKGMDMKAKSGTHKGSGTVSKVDAADGTVAIAHGAIESMNWPAMTMTFAARDRKMLDGLRPGAKVQFEFVQQGSRYVITSIH